MQFCDFVDTFWCWFSENFQNYTTSGSDFCESFRTSKTFQKSGTCHERTGKGPGQRCND